MSTLDTNKKTFIKRCIVYAAVTLLLYVFSAIYHHYSYGESSAHMKFCFLCPLLAGVIPTIMILLTHTEAYITRLVFNLHNSGIACCTAACIIRGIVEISGRTTTREFSYFAAGGIFFLLAFLFLLKNIHSIQLSHI